MCNNNWANNSCGCGNGSDLNARTMYLPVTVSYNVATSDMVTADDMGSTGNWSDRDGGCGCGCGSSSSWSGCGCGRSSRCGCGCRRRSCGCGCGCNW